MLEPLEPALPDPLLAPLDPEPPLADESLLAFFFCFVLVLPVLLVPAEPLDPEPLLSIELPLEPEPLVPLEPVLPLLD